MVVDGLGPNPLILLTSRKVTRSRKSQWRVVESYLGRWRVDETIRFIKQSYQLEDIRLLKYERLRNLVMLVLATAYFASGYLGKRAKLVILVQHISTHRKTTLRGSNLGCRGPHEETQTQSPTSHHRTGQGFLPTDQGRTGTGYARGSRLRGAGRCIGPAREIQMDRPATEPALVLRFRHFHI